MAVLAAALLCASTYAGVEAKVDASELIEGSGQDEYMEFAPQVLLDQKNVKVTLVSEAVTENKDYQLHIEVENLTDQDIYVYMQNTCLNGWLMEPYWSAAVTAGNTYAGTLLWYGEDLTVIGIDPNHITQISADLIVCDNESFAGIVEKPFEFYPHGKSAFADTARDRLETDMRLMQRWGVSIFAVSFDPETAWGESTLGLYVRNSSHKTMTVSLDDVAVNDRMCEPYWSLTIPGGIQSCSQVFWSESMLEEIGVDQIEKIEGTFRLYDTETEDLLFEKAVEFEAADLLQE